MSKRMSFIIPVYNVEKYLRECVDSILGQLTAECEIILVDDGSTDGSGNICDEYANKTSQIKVVHQRNEGSAAARNKGLDLAEGDYIAFVDSDDYIAENCLKDILFWTRNAGADICFMQGKKFFPNGKTQRLDAALDPEMLRKDKLSAIKYLSGQPKFPGSPCTKLFKKSMLQKNKLRFPEDRRLSEDLGFVLQCILKADSLDVLSIDYYFYRQLREGSNTNKVTYKSYLGMKQFVEESVGLLTEKNQKPKGEIEKYAMSFVAYEYSILIWQYSRMKKENKSEVLRFLKDYYWVLPYGTSRKTRSVCAMTRFLGIRGSSKVLDFYMRNR